MRTAVTAVAIFVASLVASTSSAHPSVSVVIDSRGNVFYSDLEQVWRIAADGKKSVAVPRVHTHELALDAQDNLYGEHLWYEGERIDKWGHYVWRRGADGRVTMVIPRTEGFRRNYSFVRDGAGNMYWADGAQIRTRAPNGSVGAVIGGRKDVRWMHAAASGTLYFVDGRDLVRVKGGKASTLVRNLADTTIVRPYVAMRHAIMGIWTDRAETVYVADHAHGVVKRVATTGQVTTVFRSTFPWSPTGGAFARNGELWVLEWSATNQARVRKVKLH